ncbi:hypothetical protein F183_A45520 [Bryobacterales bacterium F-183]|nr:hypothetical protein F183_A45520 [Bryobacterales bacterium F-183]
MKRTFLLAVLCLSALSAAPKIKVNHARNAASYASPLAPNSGVAPGSRFIVIGEDLGPAESDPSAVTVKVNINGATYDAQVISATNKQVVAVMPADAQVGQGTVTLTFAGESAETPVIVKERAVGIFATGSYGDGAAIATNADGNAITLLAPANPGKIARLRATGFGASLEGEIEVRIGSDAAANVSVNRVADQPGIDEIQFEVPASANGCFVPVAVRTGNNTWANFVTLAVAAEGTRCTSATLGAADIDRIASGELKEVRVSSTIGSRVAISMEGVEMVTDAISGSFHKMTIEDFAAGGQFQGDFALGSCYVPAYSDIVPEGEVPETRMQPLKTGNLTLNGPKGPRDLGRANGDFAVELGQGFSIPLPPGVPAPPSSLYLEPGTYRYAATAGEDVGAFNVEFQYNPAIWNNSNTISTVDRSKDLPITWTGGGANDLVVITGSSAVESDDVEYSRTFICVAKASAGSFTVPSYILRQLPEGPVDRGMLGVLSVSEPKSFTAQGLDTANVSTMRMALQQASYR